MATLERVASVESGHKQRDHCMAFIVNTVTKLDSINNVLNMCFGGLETRQNKSDNNDIKLIKLKRFESFSGQRISFNNITRFNDLQYFQEPPCRKH